MNDDVLAKFAQGLRGEVIGRKHPEYEEARKLYNAMIDKRPLSIARCADVADVISAVNFGRDNGLPLAVRGGGHNGPGLGSVDDGLVIDLSFLKGVRVDPKNRTVRVGPGCTTGDVDHATHAFGQAVPFGIISTTGVGGLTLSGGHGYLSRQYGLTVDSLLEADVVLADGSFVIASETENSDLLWALRGGGGNFGVVTSFLFRTHPASMGYGGPIIFELSDGAAVMRWFREFQPSAPDEFGMFLALQTVPSVDPFPKEHWSKKMCALVVFYNGPLAEGEKAMNKVRAQLPKPIIDWVQPMPYTILQTLFDALLPKGLQWYWKGDFVKELPDAAIEQHLAHAARLPSEASGVHLYPVDGAVHRKEKGSSAWGYRDAAWSLVIYGADPDPAKAPALKQWARDYWTAVHPFDLPGAYANFMMDDEGDARVRAAFGENYGRLATLKKKYDPANLFRVNQNIRPAA
ncbi:MAG: FAD-binding oxidoreductase [Burkholderiaceae bacterium]